MNATLDETIEFEQTELAVGSWRRASIERCAAGVDGAVKVDLGRLTREIVQKVVMRAASRAALMAKVDIICDMANGACHTAETPEGDKFENLWIDTVKIGSTDYRGSGPSCEVEIRYMQLRDS